MLGPFFIENSLQKSKLTPSELTMHIVVAYMVYFIFLSFSISTQTFACTRTRTYTLTF